MNLKQEKEKKVDLNNDEIITTFDLISPVKNCGGRSGFKHPKHFNMLFYLKKYIICYNIYYRRIRSKKNKEFKSSE